MYTLWPNILKKSFVCTICGGGFEKYDTWDQLSSRFFVIVFYLPKWGNFLATIFEFMYILASLDLNHHIPIIQNFPHKICIRTKFWTFPTKDNSCPSMHSSIQQIQHWPPFPYCALIVISFTTKFRLSWDFGTAPELLTCPLLSFSVQLLATYVCVLCTLTDRCRGNWIRDQVLNRHMILTFGLTSYIISRPSWINAPWGGKLPAGQDKGLLISLDTPWAAT